MKVRIAFYILVAAWAVTWVVVLVMALGPKAEASPGPAYAPVLTAVQGANVYNEKVTA